MKKDLITISPIKGETIEGRDTDYGKEYDGI